MLNFNIKQHLINLVKIPRGAFHMEQILHPNLTKITKFLWVLLIISLFLPIRYVFQTYESTILGQFSDFTSFLLYLSDFLLLSLILLGILQGWFKLSNIPFLIGSVIIILLFVFQIREISSFNLFWLFKFAEFLFLFEITRQYFKAHSESFNLLSKIFIVSALFISILAIFQHFLGHSLGFTTLGESILNTSSYGVAKIVAHGTTYLRGYGTFPHPNVLSAYLFCSILLAFSYIISVKSRKSLYLYGISLIILVFGLFVTFSRGAIFASMISLGLFVIIYILKTKKFKRLVPAICFLAIGVLISLYFLNPLLSSRATLNDSAVKERAYYNQIGFRIIKDKPFFGVGVGESMLHMEQYSGDNLEPWEIQPIHNYYLLSAAEGGLVFSLILISIFLFLLIKLVRFTWNTIDENQFLYSLTLLSILTGFLILMFFDHYFYTLQQTEVLLWIILGLITAIIHNKKTLNTE